MQQTENAPVIATSAVVHWKAGQTRPAVAVKKGSSRCMPRRTVKQTLLIAAGKLLHRKNWWLFPAAAHVEAGNSLSCQQPDHWKYFHSTSQKI
jgi:hypothetical protein